MDPLRSIRVIAAPEHRDRLIWAVRVRWLVIGGFLGLAILARPFGLFPGVWSCVAAAAAGASVNAANHWCVRRSKWVLPLTVVAVPMDSVLITYVVAQTGGPHSPFLVMYSVQVVSTAMLVNFSAAIASVVLAVCCFAGLLALDAAHWLTVTPLYTSWLGADLSRAAQLGDAAWVAFLVYCLVLLIFVGGYISERLQWSEGELRDKNARLEESVLSLQRARNELSEAYERLQQAEMQLVHSEKMQALGTIVAGIAHELNNPLSFLSANIHHLRAYFTRLASVLQICGGLVADPAARAVYDDRCREAGIEAIVQDLPEMLGDCEEGMRRAKQIVSELRTFSRGGAAAEKQPVDVIRGLRSTLSLLRERFKDSIRLHLDLEQVPEIHGLGGQLNQVFLNLLLNAADAVGEEGNVWVTTRYRSSDATVFVRIRDDGCGIAPEHLRRVFDPFFTTKEVGKGTGLGLSISYGIVRRHGGTLTVESQPGQGAVFEIRLPLEGGGVER